MEAIAVENLTKRFDGLTAVDDLSFTVRSGAVTGFLGPNGSGKTTTLRMLLGLMAPTSGHALINGRPYGELPVPPTEVGAALEASSFHPGRSGLDHLRMYAPLIGASDARCRELIDFVGLSDAGTRRVGGYSMGMRQRLGLAYALLGDPPIVILDEPANGLDPEGIVWLRGLLRSFAANGKTVLVSSHVLGEVASTVDDVVIIAGGRLVHSSSLAQLQALADVVTEVRSPTPERVIALAHARGWDAQTQADGRVLVRGVDEATMGAAMYAAGTEVHRLVETSVGLEDVFLRLTHSSSAGVQP